jgi:hypothetical protein
MNARLYLTAARDDPLLAAWVSVLDAHGMPHRTDVAPPDWEDAFEQLFNLGFIASAYFNALDFKREFRHRRPPERDVEAALSALANLRQPSTQEIEMAEFDLFEKQQAALAPRNGGSLSRHPSFEPLAPRRTAPNELIDRPVMPSAQLAPLEPTRRAIQTAAARPGLPCHAVGDDRDFPLDPRTYVDDFEFSLFCCGCALEIVYDDGQDVTRNFPDRDQQMVEFCWHAVCTHCNSEHFHTVTRPLPADYLPR